MQTPNPSPRASLDALFNPCAIAVYGASSDPTKIGGRPLDFLKGSGYAAMTGRCTRSTPSRR